MREIKKMLGSHSREVTALQKKINGLVSSQLRGDLGHAGRGTSMKLNGFRYVQSCKRACVEGVWLALELPIHKLDQLRSYSASIGFGTLPGPTLVALVLQQCCIQLQSAEAQSSNRFTIPLIANSLGASLCGLCTVCYRNTCMYTHMAGLRLLIQVKMIPLGGYW